MSSGRVEFFLSASDLTAHHAFVAVYLKNLETKEWNEIGRTAVSYNSNPRFANQFIVPFVFEEEQQLRFDIYRAVQNQTAVISKNIIGSAAFKLSEVVHAKHQMLTRTLTKGRKVVKNRASKRYARLNIRLEPLNEEIVDNVAFNFEASNLPKQGAFSKSNAILELHRLGSDGKFFKIHETEVAKKTLDPNWSEFTLTSTKLCNGDGKRTLQLKAYHCEKDQRKYIGKCQTDYDKLLHDANKEFALKDPKGKQCGSLRLTNIRVLSRKQNSAAPESAPAHQEHYEQAQNAVLAQQHDLEQQLQHDAIRKLQEAKSNRSRSKFLNYLQGNCELSLMVAIDFTGSNGYATDPNSLHHIYQPMRPSPYQAALRSICSILAQYDTDQQFPVWGFGAKFPQHEQAAHDFQLNPDGEEVDGVSGIESAYVTAIQSNAFQFSGPCCYSPILTKAINETVVAHNRVMQDGNERIQYYILLVLTNGQICEQDKQPTKNLLIYASNNNLPLSIIFVGIGDGDFSFLNELDGDFEPIKDDQGHTAKRDIVQFVAMKEFADKDRHELSRYTLREIPIQFVSYVDNNRIEPRKKQMFTLKRTASKYFQEDEEDADGGMHLKGDTMYQISEDDLADSEEEKEEEEAENALSPKSSADMDSVPLPVGWEKGYTASGRPFYINHKTRSTQWYHPLQKQLQQPKTSQELSELQQKQAAAYNVQLMNASLDYGNTKSTATAKVQFAQSAAAPQHALQPQRAQTIYAQAPQQALQQQRSTASLQPQRAQTMYAQAPQQAPAQAPQQARVVYAQPAQPQPQSAQRVVYAQPQQPRPPQQQRVVFDQFGRQVVLPMRAQPQPQQQVVYAQPHARQQVAYGQQRIQYVQAQPPQQQRVVYAQQPQQVQYAQPQHGQPQQRVIYAQPQQQVIYQQQQPPQQPRRQQY